jgi:hypothetical protein
MSFERVHIVKRSLSPKGFNIFQTKISEAIVSEFEKLVIKFIRKF